VNRIISSLTAALILVAIAPANAANFDVRLVDEKTGVMADSDFRALSMGIAMAMQPRWSGPANTMGSRGFDIGYNIIQNDIDGDAQYWKDAVPDRTLNGLQTSQIHFRKGLPYSFELGGTVSSLHESRLYGVGFELKWAFVESYKYAPDIGMRTHVSTTLGSRDLSLLNAGADMLMSKSIGIGGVVQATPFLGYSFCYTQARSHVLGITQPGEVELDTDIIDPEHMLSGRLLVGLALHASWAELGFEAAIPLTEKNEPISSYTMRVGLQF
jgi:hypothetical protein